MGRPKKPKSSLDDPTLCRQCKAKAHNRKASFENGKNRYDWTCEVCHWKNTTYADEPQRPWNPL